MSTDPSTLADAVLARWGHDPHALVQVLRETQALTHWLSRPLLAHIARALHLTLAHVEGVATFYRFFHTRPVGRTRVLFSDNITDRMLGSHALMDRLCQRLGIQPGEVDAQGRFSVDKASCTGLCDQGPALLVNHHQVVTRLDAARIDKLADLLLAEVPVTDWPADWFKVENRVYRAGPLLSGMSPDAPALPAVLAREPQALIAELAEVNVITAKPTDVFEANARAEYGNYNAIRLRGMVNVPIFGDKLAVRLSGATLKRYPHGDADGAARQLAAHPDGAALLASDGVFSMDGDVAPLRELATVAREHGATLYIDDAHGVGVLGEAGRGSIAAAELSSHDVPLRLVTFGKALGSAGAALVGDADLIAHLAETARPHIYTTALPPAQAAATLAAVRVARCMEGDALRARLQANIVRFRAGAVARGLPLLPSDTAIQPLLVGGNADALKFSAALEACGYWVTAIRPPTVPEGSARLRIALSALHEAAQIDGLLEALQRVRDSAVQTPPTQTYLSSV